MNAGARCRAMKRTRTGAGRVHLAVAVPDPERGPRAVRLVPLCQPVTVDGYEHTQRVITCETCKRIGG